MKIIKKENSEILKVIKMFIKKHRRIFLCLVFGFCTIGILSMTSPLYSYNPWADANIYLTTTRQMLRGKMLYRDVFDHKGPYLYLIHIPAVMISQWSFTGVYVIESLSASAFAWISLKTVHAETKKKALLALIGCFAVYGTVAFAHSDSAEEYCLPLLMASFYALETENYFLAGVMAGCVFWTKMTMCSYYIGWYIVMLVQYGMNAVRKTPKIIAGLAISSAPAIAMFALQPKVLWDGYFASNILYGLSGVAARHFSLPVRLYGILSDFCEIIFPFLMTLNVIVADRKRRFSVLVTWLFLLIPILYVNPYMGQYYYLAATFYAPLWAGIKTEKGARHIIEASVVVFALVTGNVSSMGKPVAQMKFVRIMKKDSGRVLEYGMQDYGFYTLMHQNPSDRYFFTPNMKKSDIEKAQQKALKSRKYKYVVTEENIGTPYKKIATAELDHKGIGEYFYLYKLEKQQKEK